MDKSKGHVQLIEGHLFYSPNCDRTIDAIPPPCRDEHGEKNIFLPSTYCTRPNFFELDIANYRHPRWWSLTFGWIVFFPLSPYMYGPLFEVLTIPRDHSFVFHEDSQSYSMPENSMLDWQRLENDLAHAISLIKSRYNLAFIYPLGPSVFGYCKRHRRPAGLHMAMRKARDWFVVWMALMSYVVYQGQGLILNDQSSSPLEDMEWYDILQNHFDPQWLEAVAASSICSLSMERAGVFLDLSKKNEEMQPTVQWFYSSRVPVWYHWNDSFAKHPDFEHLGPLSDQLQNATTTIAKTPASHAELPVPERAFIKRETWQEFFQKKQSRYEEHLKTEIKQQKQVRLSRLQNPPKHSAKVFEWLKNSEGDLVRVSVSAKMRERTLGSYATYQIYYDAKENEYDCCDEYNSGVKNVNVDDNDIDDDDDLSWAGEPGEIVDLNDINYQPLNNRDLFEVAEYNDAWCSPNPFSAENFISEILSILEEFFGYTPLVPTPVYKKPLLEEEKDKQRFMRFLGLKWSAKLPVDAFGNDVISAAAAFVWRLTANKVSDDEWDLSSENRASLCYSRRIKSIRMLESSKGILFMFDFKDDSTVPWNLTLTTAAHALLVCRLDDNWSVEEIVQHLLDNGIPFHTLQLSNTLPRSPFTSLPELLVPFRPVNYAFTWRDYCTFRQRCHDIFKQPRGRAALMRGGYPWRLAMTELGVYSVLTGPSGLSTDPQEMLLVKNPETEEEYIDDQLTDMELKILSGLYEMRTDKGQKAQFSWYPAIISFERSEKNQGRWTENLDAEFEIADKGNQSNSHRPGTNSDTGLERPPLSMRKWKNSLKNGGDTINAMHHLNAKALEVIKKWGTK